MKQSAFWTPCLYSTCVSYLRWDIAHINVLFGSLRATPPLCDLFGQEFQTTHLLLSVNALQGLAQNFDKYLGLPFPNLVHRTVRLESKHLIEL